MRLLRVCFWIALLAVPANLLWDAAGRASPVPYNVAVGAIFAAFCWLHGSRHFGRWQVSTLLATSATVSFVLEFIGVRTGRVYGQYHYGEILGPKILDTVPWLIPISWFMFMYCSAVVTEHLLEPRAAKAGVVGVPVRVAVDSMVMTALDILIDPIWVSRGAWTWTGAAELRPEALFYGIPVQNYAGWLATNAIVFGVFRLVHHSVRKTPAPTPDGGRAEFSLPIWIYAAISVVGAIEALILLRSQGVAFVALMTSGLISLLAIGRRYPRPTG